MNISSNYPEFEYDADQLSKFIAAADMVTIMLKDGSIIHHSPKDKASFIKWLLNNKVADIKKGE